MKASLVGAKPCGRVRQQSCVQKPCGSSGDALRTVLSPLRYVIEPTGRFRNEMEKESGKAERRKVLSPLKLRKRQSRAESVTPSL